MNDNSKNSTSKKICPFMSGDDPERVFQFCKEEECMAWGIVKTETERDEQGKIKHDGDWVITENTIYGCKLIEVNHER